MSHQCDLEARVQADGSADTGRAGAASSHAAAEADGGVEAGVVVVGVAAVVVADAAVVAVTAAVTAVASKVEHGIV
jgi:hypothetical protein